MPTDLGERPGFIYFGADPGTNRENHAIAAPYPTQGRLPRAGWWTARETRRGPWWAGWWGGAWTSRR